ncbi:hypothetical protein [Endozoicomonas atrinae]|nr:hypothetical protein [Endozoicomonas atrinae]
MAKAVFFARFMAEWHSFDFYIQDFIDACGYAMQSFLSKRDKPIELHVRS